ncbi:MAG: hypothetical protein JWO86_725 [Myxococcaceae bacterium]|nr:hypothetical protein [Myxococcaceae bacterium]
MGVVVMHRVLTAARTTHLHGGAEMARCAAMRFRMPASFAIAPLVVAVVAAIVVPAHADERPNGNRFALDLGGVRQGFVRASVERSEPAKNAPELQRLVLTAQDVAPSLASVVESFAQSKPVKRDVRLTSGAVVRKANDARLASVKLPALGSGGAAEIELGFAVSAVSTQPLLSAKEAPPSPSSTRITGFRVDLSGMQAIEAPKLDAITITQKPDGSATTGELAIEVAAGGAPPFVAWQKAGAKAAPRNMRVEYIGPEGAVILKLQLERCTPSSVTPLGANGTTRITLSCAALGQRGGS